MSKPTVTTKCVANQYAGPNERIIEFSFPNGKGGLITFFTTDSGALRVDVYNYDEGIEVVVGKPRKQHTRTWDTEAEVKAALIAIGVPFFQLAELRTQTYV